MAAHYPLLSEGCAEVCPSLVRDSLRVIGTKWAVPILFVMLAESGALRYAELRRRVRGITPKELAKHLRALEAAGLVDRTVHPTVPPRVEYRLTERGETTSPLLEVLARWGASLANTHAERPLPCEAGGTRYGSGNVV